MSNNSQEFFFVLLRAGLWEKEVRLSEYKGMDFSEVYRLASEQSVVGLVAAGIEHVRDVKIRQSDVLPFMGTVLQLEQKNTAMDRLVAQLIGCLRKQEVYTLLLKGQGIAQCYERPGWRACGDVDLFLSDDNYGRAKAFLSSLSSSMEPERDYNKHLGMVIDGWDVELHGRLRGGLSLRVDKVLDAIQDDTFYGGSVRSWEDQGVTVFQLSVENDIVYVFTHILSHFYKGGIGLRQICDWCRLMWWYREKIKISLIEKRIEEMRLVSEWKAFGAFAVEYLGMPPRAMPMYDEDIPSRKADQICRYVMRVGNFGHNRDMSFYHSGSYLGQKVKSFGRRMGDLWHHARLFPVDTLRFFPRIVYNGLRSAVRGE